ncbi:MAG: putative MraZ protein [Acidobacteriaceae bacterium]|nr:putative MraZ protein [Acidobacteriaceae bacterium]
MFRGNHPTRVDEKGRLKVPAEFKRVIDEKYGSAQFYITSLDGNVAQLYPFEEWERIEQKLAALSTFNPTKKKFLSRVNYYGQVVEMDGQGRLLIPQLLRDAAQIKGEVAVLGNLTYLEVRNLETFRKEIEEQQFTPEDESTLDELGL